MAFQRSKYSTDEGTVVNIRVSSETLGATGQAVPAGAVDDANLWAFASNPGSRRKKALNARGVVLGRTVGTAPNQFVRRTFLPILTKAALDAITIDSAVTLNGVAYTVQSKVQEA
jgi:hypothetical protein